MMFLASGLFSFLLFLAKVNTLFSFSLFLMNALFLLYNLIRDTTSHLAVTVTASSLLLTVTWSLLDLGSLAENWLGDLTNVEICLVFHPIGIYLMFSPLLEGSYGFSRGRPQRGSTIFITPHQDTDTQYNSHLK